MNLLTARRRKPPVHRKLRISCSCCAYTDGFSVGGATIQREISEKMKNRRQFLTTLKLYHYLYDKRGISAWPIRDQEFAGLWLCPYPFSTPAELDALASAVLEVADKGLSA
jgi:hypothetical protein